MSGYRYMWTIVMFDLPVVSDQNRKLATQFRNNLVKSGYSMLQFSIYSKICSSEKSAEKEIRYIRRLVPEEGHVRIMKVTHKQYASMKILSGERKSHEKHCGRQLFLFET
ncbi:CRISPR-associated endoribonuclease Cas2 [Spirochaetota bacterium]|nr:CRISPR-associated endoribonuclease Cas2 [Spirochaetota bacterium]